MLPNDAVLPLLVFMALIIAAALHGLAASGHFPRQQRPAAATGVGPIILFGSIVIVIVCIVAAIGAAARLVPWYAAVIGAGLSLLLAPLALQQLPDRFVDGRGALIVFSAASLVLALLLVWRSAIAP